MDLSEAGNAVDVDDSADSSSDIVKPDYAEASIYDSQMESGSESQIDFGDVGMRNSATSGLTMKEYEEQLKKLTAENFNLKLRVYFVEERLSKVTGISDKEDLIKKNIQLKVTCESQLKELEKKQELLFEASKAFEMLQKEHMEELDKLTREKDKEISDWEEKCARLEAVQNEMKAKFSYLEDLNGGDGKVKSVEDYEKQISETEGNRRVAEERVKELENLLRDKQLELESYALKSQSVETELDQRMRRMEEIVEELEQKERCLASANFRIRKLEDDLKSKSREDEIVKERIEEKNKTIESLKSSLASRYDTIEALENRLAKERSSSQTMQTKMDSLFFQNSRLKEDLKILQSRLERAAEGLSPRAKGRTGEEEMYKQKYEDLVRAMEEQEVEWSKNVRNYQELCEKHKKLEDDHRKACTALKNFIKKSGDEKKEREVLNHMLNSHEEVIADLKSQLDRCRNSCNGPLPRNQQDEKLSLSEVGDDNRNFDSAVPGKETISSEKDESRQGRTRKEEEEEEENDSSRRCEMEMKMERISQLEAEVVVLDRKLKGEFAKESSTKKDDEGEEEESKDSSAKKGLAKELERKKSEIEKLNGEIKRRNHRGKDELESEEMLEKNLQLEKLKNRLAEMGESNKAEVSHLKREIDIRDRQLILLQNKLKEMASACPVLEKAEGFAEERENFWIPQNEEEECRSNRKVENERGDCVTIDDFQQFKSKATQSDAVKICSMLSSRLEELALFLDSLLRNNESLREVDSKNVEGIREAMEKSKELSKQLSQSFAKKDASENLGDSGDLTFFPNHSESGERIASDQTLIIERLRDQLKILNQEIKQRDIELSRCQGIEKKIFDDEVSMNFSDEDGIEKQTMSICQEISDDFEEEEEEEEEDEEEFDLAKESQTEKGQREEESGIEKIFKRKLFFFVGKNPIKEIRNRETSESEAWSEPDRSVSLARMGKIEDVGLCPTLSRNQGKGDEDSSDSSGETLDESSRPSGKRCRSAESEIRRLQSRVKTLSEANENLRGEIASLKKGENASRDGSRMQKNEEDDLAEKLRATTNRLEECDLACRQMEEKLAAALERASASAVQLKKATETISLLEEQMRRLKEEMDVKMAESESRRNQIAFLERKIEEMTVESQVKLMEAVRQREAAERKTFEVECRLKDAENISREVESKVNEIEKKINESKKFKKETALSFKEAEKHVDAAEKMMEEAERIKSEAERKSRDFQNFIDLMRKEVEEKMKEAERRIKKSEKEKDEMEKQVAKLKKRLMEAERNKVEVESKVREGKETIRCMEEKLKELEVAMDQCNDEAQRRIKEMQKKADARVAELESKNEERKAELEKKMMEADKISRELETGFRKQLEEAEKRVGRAKENAEIAIGKVQEESKKREAELRQRLADVEAEKKKECSDLLRKLDEVKLESSEFELELTRLTNEKIHLEEELKKVLDKESALVKDNREIRGKYENSIHQLEDKLTQLALNKSQLASRLEEIESTNIDLVSRISAIRGKETMLADQEFPGGNSPSFSPPRHGSPQSGFFGDVGFPVSPEIEGNPGGRRCSTAISDPGETSPEMHSIEALATPPRRNMNSSPDLGIESDPGRFSSLEANHVLAGPDRLGIFDNLGPLEMKKLECENAELRRRLTRTRQALEETLTQLSAANQRKKQVERAICKQLHKTHHILRKARVNFEIQDGGDSPE